MSLPPEPGNLDRQAWRAAWLLSTVWLVFMAFPILSLWWGTELVTWRKVAATVVAGLFAVVYALAMRQAISREVYGPAIAPERPSPADNLAALIGLNVVAFLLGSWAMLGMVPFIVAYAVFNLSWRVGLTVIAIANLAVIVPPLLDGVYDDVWPITPAVATASLATSVWRRTDERAAEQAAWRTELLLSEDRNRVARDVHDVLGHSLTAVVVKAELAARLLSRLDPTDEADRAVVDRSRAELAELRDIGRRSLAEIRATVGGLRNPDLADEVAAARTVLADAGVSCTTVGDVAAVPVEARGAMAWVVRESITNVVRHAHASHCTITLAPSPGTWLRIEDDGVGTGGMEEGNGLTGVRERLASVDAELAIADAHPSGVRLEVRGG